MLMAMAWTPLAAPAASRASVNYSVTAETVDAGGGRSVSAAYVNHGSVAGIGGVSSAGAPVLLAKHSYVGQLYELAGLNVTAADTNVNEGATWQLNAIATLDDTSVLPLAGPQVVWSVVSGPIAGINSSGLATADYVYQDTAAAVRGDSGGPFNLLGLRIVNIGNDDFGLYAGDGMEDGWQAAHFGTNNPNAAPGADPDGDGQTNYFEWVADTLPTNAQSRFHLSIAAAPSQPTWKDIQFSPCYPSRTYSVRHCANLMTGAFCALTGTVSDVGDVRTVTDTNAPAAARFYQVRIVCP